MCQCEHSKPLILTLKIRAPVYVLVFFILFTHEISNIWWQFKNVILKLNKICYVFVDSMDIAQEFFFYINPNKPRCSAMKNANCWIPLTWT